MDWDLIEEVAAVPEDGDIVPANSLESLLVEGSGAEAFAKLKEALPGIKGGFTGSEISTFANADDTIVITGTTNGPADVDTGGTFIGGGNTSGEPLSETDSPMGEGDDDEERDTSLDSEMVIVATARGYEALATIPDGFQPFGRGPGHPYDGILMVDQDGKVFFTPYYEALMAGDASLMQIIALSLQDAGLVLGTVGGYLMISPAAPAGGGISAVGLALGWLGVLIERPSD